MILKSGIRTNLASIGLTATSVLAFSGPAMAAAIGVNWTTETSGNLNGTTVTLSNINSASIFVEDLSGIDYSAAPLSSSEPIIAYDVNSDWTASFSSPVSNLLLYPVFWRGSSAEIDPVTYTFNQSFTILSGLTGATVVGNTLTVPASVGFANGIIQFTGPVSTLSVNTNSTSSAQQALTFGINNNSPTTTPEPGSVLALLGLGLGVLVSQGKKQA